MIIEELKLRNYPYKSRKGLSETIAKNHFQKRGFEVFRGTMILGKEWSVNYGLYENVKKKYDRLEAILFKKLKMKLYDLRAELKGGIPDFFVYKLKDSFFAEIKLEHEQVKAHQFKCLKLLEEYGFKVRVLRVKSKPYRLKAVVSLEGNMGENLQLQNRLILEKQEKMKIHW